MKKSFSLLALMLSVFCLLWACKKKEPVVSSPSSSSTSITVQQSEPQDGASSEPSVSQTEPKENPQNQQTSNSTPASATTPATVAIPDGAVGSWSGRTPQAETVSFTISADGTIHTVSDFDPNGPSPIEDTTARMTELVQVAEGIYLVKTYEGDVQALTPGVTGRGGAGATVYLGFILEGNTYTPINWIVPHGSEIDYNNWSSFPDTVFQKQ